MVLIGDIPLRNATMYPNDIWLHFEGKDYSWKELNEKVNSVSNGLKNLNVKKGQRVALLLENCDELVISYFAIPKLGALVVPMNYMENKEQLLYMLNDCSPNTFIYGNKYRSYLELFQEKNKSIKNWICVNDSETELEEKEIEFRSLYDNSVEEPSTGELKDIEPAFVQYTGGTTGKPKGVIMSHRSISSNPILVVASTVGEGSFDPDDKSLIPGMPLFHTAATLGLLTIAQLNIELYLHRRFIVHDIFEAMKNDGITGFSAVPTMLNFLINSSEVKQYKKFFPNIKAILYGASPISPTVLRKTMKLFPNAKFGQLFGQTETGPTLTLLNSSDHQKAVSDKKYEYLLRSAGKPIVGVIIKIVDDKGNELPQGQIGEIVAKTDTSLIEYWNKPNKTKKTKRNGWIYTGDMGYLDENGYLFVVDRKKDMIISGGENIYTKEVEDAIQTHEAVLECAVIGIPDEQWGESVHAIIVLKRGYKKGKDITEAELIAHVKDQIARYKAPKSISFKRTLPKSAQGKLLKRKLRKKYWKEKERKIA
ncbi:MAG: long-chain-fatty-acid--CoA ligase [Candidatus Lokiarchaeota archaeon]|nr:long-chain-fatty-acid--CoA ligase [Candidatus Lokiarchaeota archaeon]